MSEFGEIEADCLKELERWRRRVLKMEAAKRFRDGGAGDFQRWRRRVLEMDMAESFRDGEGGDFQRWRQKV